MTQIQEEKTAAVRGDDLDILNECIKQEQAVGMTLRGLEQKRVAALKSLSLERIPLSNLVSAAPEDCRDEARRISEALLRQHSLFRGAYDAARDILEVNLHQIEKVLEELGHDKDLGPGYQDEGPTPPANLRTDFRV